MTPAIENRARELLTAMEEGESPVGPAEERDWSQASLEELCEHIVSVHHEGLRGELPRIAELLETVVRVHGEGRPELELTERAFTVLRTGHQIEHVGVGRGLLALRGLAEGYDTSQVHCATHRSLLDALVHFEADLHRHLHEENNVLFPRARQLEADRRSRRGPADTRP